jgi:hypothetical protein
MTIEQQVSDLTTATTELLSQILVKKSVLDTVVSNVTTQVAILGNASSIATKASEASISAAAAAASANSAAAQVATLFNTTGITSSKATAITSITAEVYSVQSAREAAIASIAGLSVISGPIVFHEITPISNIFYVSYIKSQAQGITPLTTGMTFRVSDWPASGYYGELLLEIQSGGFYGFDMGSSVNWIKADGSSTLSFSASGYTLQSSGTDFVLLWTRNGGSKVWGRIMR